MVPRNRGGARSLGGVGSVSGVLSPHEVKHDITQHAADVDCWVNVLYIPRVQRQLKKQRQNWRLDP